MQTYACIYIYIYIYIYIHVAYMMNTCIRMDIKFQNYSSLTFALILVCTRSPSSPSVMHACMHARRLHDEHMHLNGHQISKLRFTYTCSDTCVHQKPLKSFSHACMHVCVCILPLKLCFIFAIALMYFHSIFILL